MQLEERVNVRGQGATDAHIDALSRGACARAIHLATALDCLTVMLVTLMVAQSVLGLLMPTQYRDADWIKAAWFGNDLMTLVIALPLMIAGRWRATFGSMRAELLWIGGVAYPGGQPPQASPSRIGHGTPRYSSGLGVHPVDNLLRPAIAAQSTKLNRMLVLIGLIGGVQAFGPSGLLIGPAIISLALGVLVAPGHVAPSVQSWPSHRSRR